MARSDINTEFNTFVGGILTEANPINYPVGFTLDEENFILERNGTRRRRRGLAIESSPVDKQVHDIGVVQNIAFDWTYWGEDKIAIIDQSTVYAYDIDTSGNISSSGVQIYSGKPGVVASFKDYLLIVERNSNRTFNNLGGGFTLAEINAVKVYDKSGTLVTTAELSIRDFETLDDGTAVDNRPAAMTNEHYYNLFNAGWSDTNITQFNTDIGVFPSRADNMNSGLDAETGVFTSSWVDLANSGNTSTTSGHFITSLFLAGSSREENLDDTKPALTGSLTTGTTSSGEIVSMEPLFGRLFYLVNLDTDSLYGRTLLCFSGSGTAIECVGDCFQTNDPTGRDTNTILDTDGGHIDISDVGIGYRIIAMKNSLFIFSSNGVYEVFSRDGIFRPTSLALRKITNEGAMPQAATSSGRNALSAVVAEDKLFYLSRGGVMVLQYDSGNSEYVPINITDSTIQTLYNSLPEEGRSSATSVYVESDRTVRFLINSSSVSTRHKNLELIYDIPLKAWYKNKFSGTAFGVDTPTLPVLAFVANANVAQSDYPVDDNLRYYCVEFSISSDNPYKFASYTDEDFVDFATETGSVENTAFMQTGYINAGDSQRYKQADYIIPSFIRTEDGFTDDGNGNLTPTNESSCNITAYWDYADTTAGGKIGTAFEAYRYNRVYIPSGPSDTFDYGQSVITTKNKLLGRGRALSLRFESSAGKDCRLLGWGLGFEVNSRV